MFRPSNNVWYFYKTTGGFTSQTWGTTGDKPVAADYDGDGKADLTVFRPSNSTWYIVGSTAGQMIQTFGQNSDLPTEGAFVY